MCAQVYLKMNGGRRPNPGRGTAIQNEPHRYVFYIYIKKFLLAFTVNIAFRYQVQGSRIFFFGDNPAINRFLPTPMTLAALAFVPLASAQVDNSKKHHKVIDTEGLGRFWSLIWPPAPHARFAVIGSYGNDSPESAKVAKLVGAGGWNADFIITTGDNRIGKPYADAIDKHYCDYVQGGGSSCDSALRCWAPLRCRRENNFFPSMGARDYEDEGGIDAYTNFFSFQPVSLFRPSTWTLPWSTPKSKFFYEHVQVRLSPCFAHATPHVTPHVSLHVTDIDFWRFCLASLRDAVERALLRARQLRNDADGGDW